MPEPSRVAPRPAGPARARGLLPALQSLEPRVLFASQAAVDAAASADGTSLTLGATPVAVQLDYTYDTSQFFNTPARRAAMQAAADEAVRLLDDALEAIDPGGENTWKAVFDHPANGTTVRLDNLTIPADTILVYVGARNLDNALAIGGPGGFSAMGSTRWIERVGSRGQADARGDGASDLGPWGGSISFDTSPTGGWHFDLAATPAPGANDFFSVAVHEVFHVLGFGTSDAFSNLVSAGRFTGPAAVAEFDGDGDVPLNSDASHWGESTREGGAETIMDSTITAGRRKSPTALDWAGLDDIGWELPVRATGAAEPVTALGSLAHQVRVTFAHYTAVASSALSAAAVTVTGPNGFTAPAAFAGFDPVDPAKPNERTALFSVAAPGGAWDPADNGTYAFRLDAPVRDAFGNASPTGDLGTFVARVEGPPGAALTAPDVAAFGGTTHSFTVTYTDDAAVAVASIGPEDVTVTGPGGAVLPVVGPPAADSTTSASPLAVTYTVAAPGGAWDPSDAGAYTVALNADQVADALGNAAAPATLGTFKVALPTIEFGGKTRATFTDADGGTVTLTLKGPGTGRVTLRGQSPADAAGVELTGTTDASSLTITATGNGTGVGGVTVNGSLKSLSGKAADLAGNLTATGSLTKVQLRNAGQGTFSASGGAPSSLQFADVTDFNVTVAGPVKSIKVARWSDTDAAPDAVTAPSLASLGSKGEFGADVLVDTLGKMSVGGTLVGSRVRSASGVASLRVGAAADSTVFAGVRPDLASLPTAAADFASPLATIKSFSVKSKSPGAFADTLVAAPVIGKVTLGAVASANGGTPFGVSANQILSLAGASDAAGAFKVSKQDAPGEAVRAGDFLVQLV